MFSDPTTITINAVAKNLIRINQDKYSSEYLLREGTGDYALRVRHSSFTDKTSGRKIDRHNVELVHTVYATSTTPQYVRKAYIVFDCHVDDVIATVNQFVAGFAAFFSSANITKLQNWES